MEVSVFLRTRKHHHAGPIETCAYHTQLEKLKNILNKADVIESCSRERMNTKCFFFKFSNLTVFAAKPKDVRKCCKDALSTEPLLKNCSIHCRTFEKATRQPYNDNLCLCHAHILLLYGTQEVEGETSKTFNLFINKMDGLSPDEFQAVHMGVIFVVKDVLTLNILLYEIDFFVGNVIVELAKVVVQRNENTVRLLRYDNHICYKSTIKTVFQRFRYPVCDACFNRLLNLEQH